jgi:NAD(P)-dependent dehydrogenase (short-subunit alcohol dehydrogenase family)
VNQYDFTDQVALVIGGTSGIGLATARGFARAGAAVVLAARDARAGEAARDAIVAAGGRALFVATDVRDDAQLARAVDAAVATFGRLDAAVNSAGHGGDLAPIDRASTEVWDDVMAVNARGVWLAMRHELRVMLAAGRGAIVNLASIYGLAGKAAHHAYVASKHAVLGVTRSVALEVAARGVRVNALCAGLTRTPGVRRAEELAPALVHDLVAEHPIGRMATEDEIADAALWLCSDGAGFVTGAPVAVDGGFLAR